MWGLKLAFYYSQYRVRSLIALAGLLIEKQLHAHSLCAHHMASQGGMPTVYHLDSVTYGHQIYYKCTLTVGDKQPVGIEEDNPNDPKAVAIRRCGVSVGHVLREMVWYLHMHRGARSKDYISEFGVLKEISIITKLKPALWYGFVLSCSRVAPNLDALRVTFQQVLLEMF